MTDDGVGEDRLREATDTPEVIVNVTADRPHLVVVGSGGQPYREYAFAALAPRYRLSAVLPEEPTWQRSYLDRCQVTNLADPDAIARAVSTLAAGAPFGLLTWDETVLEATAQAAKQLGAPHMSPVATARCRDKYQTRSLLAQAGLPAVQYQLVHSEAEAVAAADEIGYPVVVKPRSLAGSLGVARADDREAVRRAFAIADRARFAGLPVGYGVLVEEYLDGPEISVDSVVCDGSVQCVHVARKRLGFPPFFEEVGHLVTGWSDAPWADQVQQLVARAHRALGVDRGVTHAEVRLTPAGPRLVELNGRLGGDLIPYASRLATGIDLVVTAAQLAFGPPGPLKPSRRDVAEVRFLYPPVDCVVGRVEVDAAAAMPGIAYAVALAGPGSRLLLPPNSALPRLAALVATGRDEQECADLLDKAERALIFELSPTVG